MTKSTKSDTKLTSQQIELLQQANEITWSLIATMSHEVRTPATLIAGLSEYMIKQEANTLSETQIKHLNSIHKGSRRLLETFEYFLKVSGITLFPQKHGMEEVDLEELCEELGLPSIEQNKFQIIPHIWSEKSLLKLILEIISSLPYTEIEHTINLSISHNETHVTLHITINHDKDIIFGENDSRLQSCQIGVRNLEGQLTWKEPENGKIAIDIALPIFQQDQEQTAS